ncbi:phosphatidylglycerophosphatase A family protein [Aurantivibrio plasticivorans]
MSRQAAPAFSYLLRHPVELLAFGFGSGCAPKAPGTFGTLAAIPLYLLLQYLNAPLYGAVLVGSFAVGIYFCEAASKAQSCHDHPGIVWDEFVGFWITMFLVPATWLTVLLGFVLFRVFDILKPWPIRWLDKQVGGGFGIMIDDVIAGIFAALCLHGVIWMGWLGAAVSV